MPSKTSTGTKDCSKPKAGRFALWQLHSAILSNPEVDLDTFKCASVVSADSNQSSRVSTGVSYGEEICDIKSDEERVSKFIGSTCVPKLSLPTLYEDEENPVTVKITCRKCLDMEAILRNFAEMHVKAFETCKEMRFRFWDFIVNWNSKLQKNLEQMKFHLIGEFITHIEQAPLSDFKEDHDFRVQFNHYRLLFTHMKSLENRFQGRMEDLKCPIRENFNIETTDKSLRDLGIKIKSCMGALQQLEQRIRSIAKSWDNARAETNPHGFRQSIFTKEDYIFNRLSNIFTCIEFLEKERKFYEEKAAQSYYIAKTPNKKPFLPPVHLKLKDNQAPKPSNVKRLAQNSVKRKLPSAIAHFYPFVKPQFMGDIHASWYRTFLRSDDMRKEINQQRDTNMRVLTDIKQLKKEIHHLETQLKMKEYVEHGVKGNGKAEELLMFPDKNASQKASSFLDFNELF